MRSVNAVLEAVTRPSDSFVGFLFTVVDGTIVTMCEAESRRRDENRSGINPSGTPTRYGLGQLDWPEVLGSQLGGRMNSWIDQTRVLTFESSRFPVPMTQEAEASTGPILASAIKGQIANLGLGTDITQNVIYGEGLWSFRMSLNNQDYLVTLGIGPGGPQHSDVWALCFIPKQRWLRMFSSPRSIGVEFERLLRDRLQANLECFDCTWISHSDYALRL